ncbi:MAG: hypothetical protein ACI4QT_07765 [Kiritimatiellia bacterium]
MISRILIVALAALCLPAKAGQVATPTVPPPVFFDTESQANAPLSTTMMNDARIFRVNVSLWATPSNNVEIAFGSSRNADKVLLPGDESFAVGWENGAWFLSSPATCVRSIAFGDSAHRSLSLILRIRADGSPLSLEIEDSTVGGIFTNLSKAPPAWLFSRDWDAVRSTIRGTDAHNETVSVHIASDSGLLMLR